MNKSIHYEEEQEFQLWEHYKRADMEHLFDSLYSSFSAVRNAAAKELHFRGGAQAFNCGRELCSSVVPELRETGAFLLGQLGTPTLPFAAESCLILTKLLVDPIATVRSSAAAALGHLRISGSVAALTDSAEDEDAKVRACSAFALGALEDPAAISVLLRMTDDDDAEVRNWTLFALNSIGIDRQDIRDKFAILLHDPSEEVRNEAMAGLSRWQDRRVFDMLKADLDKENISYDSISAAGNLGDKRLLPRLQGLLTEWGQDSPAILNEAIQKLEK